MEFFFVAVELKIHPPEQSDTFLKSNSNPLDLLLG